MFACECRTIWNIFAKWYNPWKAKPFKISQHTISEMVKNHCAWFMFWLAMLCYASLCSIPPPPCYGECLEILCSVNGNRDISNIRSLLASRHSLSHTHSELNEIVHGFSHLFHYPLAGHTHTHTEIHFSIFVLQVRKWMARAGSTFKHLNFKLNT